MHNRKIARFQGQIETALINFRADLELRLKELFAVLHIQSASIKQIFKMQRLSPTQLHWPDLDADIEIDALEQPEHYPLVWGNG